MVHCGSPDQHAKAHRFAVGESDFNGPEVKAELHRGRDDQPFLLMAAGIGYPTFVDDIGYTVLLYVDAVLIRMDAKAHLG